MLIIAPVAISIIRGPEHRFELVNRFAQEIIGTRQVEGKTIRDVTYQPLFAADGSVSGILSTSIDTAGYRDARKHLEGGARKAG